MSKKLCRCTETRNQIVVDIPKGIGDGRRDAAIDECIWPVIQHLWRNKINTLNCCCGHGKEKPSIILNQSTSFSEARKIEGVIKEVDDRDFNLLSWRLEKVN